MVTLIVLHNKTSTASIALGGSGGLVSILVHALHYPEHQMHLPYYYNYYYYYYYYY